MAVKKPSSSFVLGLTAMISFSVLFATHLVTEPILINRANEADLTLLNLDSFANYDIGEVEQATGELLASGIQTIKPFLQNNNVVAVTYSVITSGYAQGLTYRIGIREGRIQLIIVDAHNETPGYGGNVISQLQTTLAQQPIADTNAWTAALVSVSTGATFTRRGLVNSLTAIRTDYLARVGGQG
ncbi:MAG: FMN-binding protein [Bacilli bacterium]